MKKMLFESPQPMVSIVLLPDGKRDITVLINEEFIIKETSEEGQMAKAMFGYDGNIFRTVYELTEEQIMQEIEKYLYYNPQNEPTLDQLRHDRELIDNYTLDLIKGGIL